MAINNVLNTKVRPTVFFDAENPEHRYWGYQFIKNRSWKGCPYVFALKHSEDNVYNMMLRMLTEYYTEAEFGVAGKPQIENVVPIQVDKRRKK